MTPDTRFITRWIAILAIPALAAGVGIGALTQPAAHPGTSVASNMLPPAQGSPTVTAAPAPATHTRAPHVVVERIPAPAAPLAPTAPAIAPTTAAKPATSPTTTPASTTAPTTVETTPTATDSPSYPHGLHGATQ